MDYDLHNERAHKQFDIDRDREHTNIPDDEPEE